MSDEYKEMLEKFEQICQNAKKELCAKEEKEKDKEIERLNNIIDELEKYFVEKIKYMETHSIERMVAYDDSLHKLKELKGE